MIYKGQNLSDFSERELTDYRRFHVGFVFQFYNLISSLTAKENVALVTDIAPDPMREAFWGETFEFLDYDVFSFYLACNPE